MKHILLHEKQTRCVYVVFVVCVCVCVCDSLLVTGLLLIRQVKE